MNDLQVRRTGFPARMLAVAIGLLMIAMLAWSLAMTALSGGIGSRDVRSLGWDAPAGVTWDGSNPSPNGVTWDGNGSSPNGVTWDWNGSSPNGVTWDGKVAPDGVTWD